jgi:hypothetical protein
MTPTAPRQFTSPGELPGAGLPHDRASRLAARRAFVDLKTVFIEAIAQIPGSRGDWLRNQVRGCEEPIDLWLLRASVLDALAERDDRTRQWRRELRRSLSALFPQTELSSGFGELTFG